MEAVYYTKIKSGKVKCNLCPQTCILSEGAEGICRVRKNNGGVLQCIAMNTYSAINLDPIEKKPLYHFFPGKKILSVGGFGCNMRCEWCQNCHISQSQVPKSSKQQLPGEILLQAQSEPENIGIAYTYNEPLINFESNITIAKEASSAGLKNVLVTNGYIHQEPLSEILSYTDAVNLDIKSFDNNLYRKHTKADLDIILNNAKQILNSGTHLEISMLIVPGVSDSLQQFKQFIKWMQLELSVEVPLHISRYFPRYKYKDEATSLDIIDKFAELANGILRYVYTGNVLSNSFKNTYCPACTNEIISRNGDNISVVGADSQGFCAECGKKIFENS